MNDDRTRKEAQQIGPGTLPSAAMIVPVNEGTILAGKYRVERVLGRGGMGVVVAATHLELEQRVALKFLLPEAMENPEVVERFAREARAAVRIESEHVARVIDVGKLDSGLPYMVMEYLHGRDLAAALDERGTFSIQDATEYVLQACEAIAQAHALGIVHRDLKPSNLFLTTRPDGTMSVKVLDFGISKVPIAAASSAEMSLTRTTDVMGSPTYMSPEQMRASRDVDPRADIWALGVILYELLTACTPFVGHTMPELCAAILKEAPAPIRTRRPEVPAGLETAISRCLEKNPAQRFAHVAELSAALVEFAPKRARLSAERCARILRGAGVPMMSLPPLLSNPPQREAVPIAVSTAATWSQAETKGETPKSGRFSGAARGTLVAVLVIASVAAFAAFRLHSDVRVAAALSERTPAAASPVVLAPEPEPAASASIAPGAPDRVAEVPVPPPKPQVTASAVPRARARSGTISAAPPKTPSEPPPTPGKKSPLNIDIK